MVHRLDLLLRPRSIAFIGASADAARIGGMPLELLNHFGYQGKVFPVNPKYQEAFGNRCYPDIESVPEVADLAVLAVSAADVTAMLRRCHARGIPAAIVYASGFAEAGAAGAALQDELEAFVRKSAMVVAGPNCMGFANLNHHAYTAFASIFKKVPAQHEPGRVSLVTQSGNVCSAVFAQVRQQGVPVSHFINTGNEASLEFSEYLEFLAADDETDTVVGYIEQLRDGKRFVGAALEFARRGKPLILLKAGESDKGSEAVRSHTSALAGKQALYKAAFRQVNAMQADDFAQMGDLAWLAGFRQRRGGRRVAILSISGALGAIIADKLIAAGHEVPTLPAALQEALRRGIPDYGMVANPVDLTGNIVNQPGFVRTICSLLATTDAIDTVLVYAPGYLMDRMADALSQTCAEHQRLFVGIDTGSGSCHARLAQAGVPVFNDLGRALRALAPFLHWMARRDEVGYWAALRTQTAAAEPATEARGMNELQIRQWLTRFGLPQMAEAAAADEDAAVAAAERLGYPVALKILSADISHKTEAGGVRLALTDAGAVRAAFREVVASAGRHAPQARLDGVLVQPMTSGVAELLLGVSIDPVFGPALAVGLGGVLTEIYEDVSHRLLPVDGTMARDMLRDLKAAALLDGFRGRPKADVEAACDAIAAFSRAALSLTAAGLEAEINPLLVRPRGQGVAVLDALVLPAGDAGTEVAE